MYGESYDKCIGCSQKILEAYQANRDEFIVKACNQPDYLEDLTGITAMSKQFNEMDIQAFDEDFDWD